MKQLVLVRHAKSSWDNPDWTDKNRPINKRGMRDAPYIAEVVAGLIPKPDLIVSSTADRAATTARIFAQALGYDENLIEYDDNIYDKGARYIIKKISLLDNKYGKVFVFGHNPDMTSLYSYFLGDYMDNIPTTGAFGVEFKIENWKDIENETGKLLFFEYPKKHFKKDTSIID